jgi:Zinc finger, C2H2 type
MLPRHLVARNQKFLRLPCKFYGCNRHFRNQSGLTKHIRTAHAHSAPERPVRNPSPSPPSELPDDRPSSPAHAPSDEDGANQGVSDGDGDGDNNRPELDGHSDRSDKSGFHKVYHPLINGTLFLSLFLLF